MTRFRGPKLETEKHLEKNGERRDREPEALSVDSRRTKLIALRASIISNGSGLVSYRSHTSST